MATKSTKKTTGTKTHDEQLKQDTSPAETDNSLPDESAETISRSVPLAALDQHVAELEELRSQVLKLVGEVQTMKIETARNAVFQKAISGVKNEVAATRALLVVPPADATGVQSNAGAYSAPVEDECGCSPCECVSPKCCCFDVIMTHFRVVHMQIEPTDTNAVPTDMLELRFFASIDPVNNIGAMIPDPTGWLPGHKGLLEPIGMWVPVYRNIGTKCLPKGTSAQITIELIVIEVETPIERVIPANRDEYGSASQTVTLDCCYSSYPPIIMTVALTGGGLDVAPGVIDAKFSIVKKC